MSRGKFITVEGSEGVGKSTNIAFIKSLLEQAGKQVVTTREPGGTALGEKIRQLLLDTANQDMVSDCELLLMFAARAQHLQQVILPAVERGDWVLCDRFTDATYAYQGSGRGVATERITALENWVQGAVRPDLTILLDIPVAQGLARAGRRGELDRFEQEQLGFFERVRNGYLALASTHATRFRIIDAALELMAVQAQIKTTLEDYLYHG